MALLSVDARSVSNLNFRATRVEHSGLPRLFAAAIVSDQFRKTLLSEPETALTRGYLGQSFSLTDREKKVVETIRADTLTDFAQQVNQALKK